MGLFKTVIENIREPKGIQGFTLEQNIRESRGYAAFTGFIAPWLIYSISIENVEAVAAAGCGIFWGSVLSHLYSNEAIKQYRNK